MDELKANLRATCVAEQDIRDLKILFAGTHYIDVITEIEDELAGLEDNLINQIVAKAVEEQKK